MYKIALTDSLHLHDRNFPSLFDFLKDKKIDYDVLLDKDCNKYGLMIASGDYKNLNGNIDPIILRLLGSLVEKYLSKDADSLYRAQSANFKLWPLCRSETMSFLLTHDNWQRRVMLKNDRAIFDKAWIENRDVLAGNFAAAEFWLNYWYDIRKTIFQYHYCCIFSGSMIYARTLLELLRRSRTKAFVMESTFTGNDYIFEERYFPVPNNLSVKFPNVRMMRRNAYQHDENQYDREVIKAKNKIFEGKNKNVIQPKKSSLSPFIEQNPIVLIVGQVANDYSLIEEGYPYIGSIPIYIEVIERLLEETSVNIIFKAHPWENKKIHLKSAKTFDAIAEFIERLDLDKKKRIKLVEDFNLNTLIDVSDYFITLCSQAALEAAVNGLKPFVLGHAFYSNAGFTCDCKNVSDLISNIREKSGILSVEEYKKLDEFLVDFLQHGTVSVFPSGKSKINSLIFGESTSRIVQKTPMKSETDAAGVFSLTHDDNGVFSILRKKKVLPRDESIIKGIKDKVKIEIDSMSLNLLQQKESSINLRATVFNESEYIIPTKIDAKKFKFSYHIFTEDGGRYVWNGEQTDLLEEIDTTSQIDIKFRVPNERGLYYVVPALLLPGTCWLDSSNAKEISVE